MSVRAATIGLACLCLATAAFAGDKKKPKTIDSLSKDAVDLGPDVPLADAGNQAREHYRRFLELQGTDPARAAEALRRLGDLELETGEAQALARGDAKLQASTYAGAIARYQESLKRYPDDPHNGVVLYQLARAQDSGGDPLGALATLDTLVAGFPNAPNLDEVQFRRGEILFAHRRFADAERAYAAVLPAGERSAFREQARYKMGWSQFRQDRHDDAVRTFASLLDARFAGVRPEAIDGTLAAMPIAAREVIDDTLRAMSLSFSSQRGLPSLQESLKGRSPAYEHLLYVNLAGQYLEQKRWTDAAAVFSGFVVAHPLDPHAQGLQQQAIAALEQGKFADQAIAARADYVERFGLDKPYWKAQKEPAAPASATYLRTSAWMVAQQHHALAQKATDAAQKQREYALAADGYRLLRTYFPNDAKVPESQFLLGEVLYESGDYTGAIAAYESAAYEFPPHARSGEAGYAALLAYAKDEARLSGEAARARHRQRLDAGVRFAAAFPNHAQASAVRLDAAEGFLAGGAPGDAVKAAATVAATAAATPEQRRAAWIVVGHASVDGKDYARAEQAYLEAWRLDGASGRKDPKLADHLAAAIYRQGEQARDAGDADTAAGAFLRVGRTVPTAGIVATADFDAAQTYLAAGRPADAVPILERFRVVHRGDPLEDQVSAKLALAYLAVKDERAAAKAFEGIAADPKTPRAEQQEALQQSAKLYAAQKDEAGETRMLEQLVAKFPEAFAPVLEARHRLIALAAAHGDRPAVKQLCERQVAAEAAGGSQRNARSKWLAAHAALGLADPAREAFLAARLTAPLAASLKRKKASMETALAAYGRAADYGVADVLTESTFRLGELYQALARSLVESDRPKGLDAQAREQYDLILQEQAFPFEEKAIELHEANAGRARDGLYDDWIRNSYASLAMLVPGKYARPARGAAPDQTRESLEAAVARDPASAPARFQLGQVLAAEGRFADADAAFAEAQVADAHFARAFYDRGMLNEVYLQRPDEAVRNYEAFQALLAEPDPQVKGWIDALRRRSAAVSAKGAGP